MKKMIISCVALMTACLAGFAWWPAEAFTLKDVKVSYNSSMSMVQGVITNNSGISYNTAILDLSFYDKNNKLLGRTGNIFYNFTKGKTLTFVGTSYKDLSKWKTYKVHLVRAH